MKSESEERENEERDSSRNEDHSLDWLEQLAGEPDAIWDQSSPSIVDLAIDLPVAEPQKTDKEISTSDGKHDSTLGEVRGTVHDKPTLEPTVEQVDIIVAEQQSESVHNFQADVARGPVVQPVSGTHSLPPEAKPDSDAAGEGRIDSIAAEQGPNGKTRDAFGWDEETQEVDDLGVEADLEVDDLMWLDDMETVSDMNVNSQENDEVQPVESPDDSTDRQLKAQDEGEIAAMEPARLDSDQVPDDPDEAIAWLERLAAKQGAPSEELPTVKSTVTLAGEETAPFEVEFSSSDEDTGEIPEDPDEAMAWLERLAARQGADADELTTVATPAEVVGPEPAAELLEEEVVVEPLQSSLPGDLDEALGWLEELTVPQEPAEEAAEDLSPITVNEEVPTPAVAHDVEKALVGAELLFAEPGSVASTETDGELFDESQIEDADDAMAWLEQLAARQGAPIEELTTLDSDSAGKQALTDLEIDPIAEMEDQFDAQDAVRVEESVEDLLPAPPIVEAPVPDELVAEPVEEPEMMTVGAATFVAEAADVAEVADIDEADAAAPELIAEEDVPAKDLAWLDTLGSVDAESWLEGEAAEDQAEAVPERSEGPEIETFEASEALTSQPKPVPGILPDAPGSEELTLARQSMSEGAVERGLATYSTLVEKGEFLPFLIDDLETVSEEQGPEPGLQRVLGDAYARNGQLRKALQAYREALDNL